MPTFDYHCTRCEKTYEIFVRDSEEIIKCEECKSSMEKQIGASNFVIKGYTAKNNYGLKGKK